MPVEVETVPAVIGYRLGEPLGRGRGGPVWAAVRERDGLDVAIKIVDSDRPELLPDTVGAGLSDPHVVAVHEVVPLAHHRTAIVMALMRGGSLRAVVAARGRMSAGEVVTVLTPLAEALGRLHRRGIVHGDLSPDNVLFDLDGRPSLSDLGASHTVGDGVRDVLGTDGFVAPEVLLGEDPTSASDVHSLCALGWFCLTGEEPDVAPGRPALGVELEAAGLLDTLPSGLVATLEAGLAPEAADRVDADAIAVGVYESALAVPLRLGEPGDVTAGLTRRLRNAMGVATPEGADPAPTRRARGRRRAASGRRVPAVGALITVAFAALAVTTVVILARGGQGAPATPGAAGSGQVVHERTRALPLGGPAPVTPAGPRDRPGAAPSPAAPTHGGPLLRAELDSTGARDVAQALSDLRATAWADPADGPWEALTVPGSPAAGADAEDRELLRAAGERAVGLALSVREARVERAGGTEAVLRVTVDASAHDLVSAAGTRTRAAVPGVPVDLVVRWDGTRWRLWEVRPA